MPATIFSALPLRLVIRAAYRAVLHRRALAPVANGARALQVAAYFFGAAGAGGVAGAGGAVTGADGAGGASAFHVSRM